MSREAGKVTKMRKDVSRRHSSYDIPAFAASSKVRKRKTEMFVNFVKGAHLENLRQTGCIETDACSAQNGLRCLGITKDAPTMHVLSIEVAK